MVMKRILLMRHGKAEQGNGKADFDRELTNRGKKQSLEAAKALEATQWIPQRIIASTAARAWESATIVAEHLGIENKLEQEQQLYLCTAEMLMETLRELPESLDTVLLVGHNPAMEVFADRISGNFTIVKTAEIQGFFLDRPEWEDVEFSSITPQGFLYKH